MTDNEKSNEETVKAEIEGSTDDTHLSDELSDDKSNENKNEKESDTFDFVADLVGELDIGKTMEDMNNANLKIIEIHRLTVLNTKMLQALCEKAGIENV